jgi:uncharacterized circularly permuted ATP-grasp superfamily protein/uncharacterized alpha-E superfamily protein
MSDQCNLSQSTDTSKLQTLLTSIGLQGLKQRQMMINKLMRQAGAHYTRIDGSSSIRMQDWELDPIPLLIEKNQWQIVQTGLAERANLLNTILQDIYGPQSLIEEGILPASFVLKNPGFVRAVHQQSSHSFQHIAIAATDIIQNDKSQFIVVNDRLQAPSGLGYTLQNRRVISKVFDDELLQKQTSRLAKSFSTLKKAFSLLTGIEDPNVAILSPGSMSETFYEQKLLSSYLGIPLVEGRDLSVSSGYVWLNTSSQQRRIDLILRRLDQEWCDPVELRGDSLLGVPGLIEVVRQGGVVIANPIGSGVLETPALLKYLPAISQHLNGKALAIKSVETFWGNEDLEQISDRLSQLIIKPFQRGPGSNGSIYGPELCDKQRDQLIKQIKLQPEAYVAQEIVTSQQTPSWQRGKITERRFITRAFSLFGDNGYRVMSGGLTRCEVSSSKGIFTNQRGAINKDTWIIDTSINEEPTTSLELTNNQSPRFADALKMNEGMFWVARYLERCRAITTTLHALIQTHVEGSLSTTQLTTLAKLLDRQTSELQSDLIKELFTVEGGCSDFQSLWTSSQLGTLYGTLQSLVFAAEAIEEFWSPRSRRSIRTIQDIITEMQFHENMHSSEQVTKLSHLTTLLDTIYANIESTVSTTSYDLFKAGISIEHSHQIINRLIIISGLENDDHLLDSIRVIEQTFSEDDMFAVSLDIFKNQLETLQHLAGDNQYKESLVNQVEQLNLSLLSLQSHQPDALIPSFREPIFNMLRQLQDLRFKEDTQAISIDFWNQRLGAWKSALDKISMELESTYCGHDMQPHLLQPSRFK